MQDVPISIQAYSADALDARGIDDPIDLPSISPGMTYTQLVGFSIIYIRGIGTDAFVPSADASVATYIDGIYFPFGHGLAQSFGAVERVEVLKGPQGTLFGRNSTGGAISVVTKRPFTEDWEASVQASYSRFDESKIRAYVNIPVADSLAVSLSAIYNEGDSFYQPTPESGKSQYDREREKGGRFKAYWAPTDSLDLTLSYMLLEQSGVANMINAQVDPYPQYEAMGARAQREPYKSDADAPTFFDARTPVTYGELNYRFDVLDTKVLLGKQRIQTHSSYDFDASSAPLVSFEAHTYADVDTVEIQFISNDGSWAANWLEWVGGLYYIKSDAGFAPVYLSLGGNILPNLPVPDPVSNLLLADLGAADSVNIALDGVLDTESSAAFIQSTARLPAGFGITFGGRYQEETRVLTQSNTRLRTADGNETPLNDFSGNRAETSNFSPKAVINRDVGESSMLYASWQKGFKSGTFNILNIYTPTQYVEPEQVVSSEIGLKTELLDGNLRLNAAVFKNEIENLQVQFISLTTGSKMPVKQKLRV